jgi:hypothetical protein
MPLIIMGIISVALVFILVIVLLSMKGEDKLRKESFNRYKKIVTTRGEVNN